MDTLAASAHYHADHSTVLRRFVEARVLLPRIFKLRGTLNHEWRCDRYHDLS